MVKYREAGVRGGEIYAQLTKRETLLLRHEQTGLRVSHVALAFIKVCAPSPVFVHKIGRKEKVDRTGSESFHTQPVLDQRVSGAGLRPPVSAAPGRLLSTAQSGEGGFTLTKTTLLSV